MRHVRTAIWPPFVSGDDLWLRLDESAILQQSSRMTERQRFFAGLAAGFLGLAVCIEAVRALAAHTWVQSFDGVLWWLGRFRWLYEYQTFIAGVAALLAARWSVRTIERQIHQAESAANLQREQVERIETDRQAAKRAAARAVLPMSLSLLSEQTRQRSLSLLVIFDRCQGKILPKDAAIPVIESYSPEVMNGFKEMIEYSTPDERVFYSRLLVSMQVQSSRILGLRSEHDRQHTIVFRSNIEAYILGEAEVYARASALYDFARGASEVVPSRITRRQVGKALFVLGLHELQDDLTERYDLEAETTWDPLKQAASAA